MAEQRTMAKSAHVPEPTQPALTYRGKAVTPGAIIRLWRSSMRMKTYSRAAILETRAYRRKEESSKIQISPVWARQHPEAASWVRAVIHERNTLEREQIARIGSVEPEYSCEPLGFLQSDDEAAEEKEAYLEEWRISPNGPPTQVFFGKGTEDGEYARVRIPAHLDMDGCPDRFEYLTERAYAALPDDEKPGYQKDDADRRQRYVKVDGDGKPQPNRRFNSGDEEKDKEAHEEAVNRYLLDKWASHGRVIPALDCAPIFSRGKGRDRWELTALVERSLHYVEELLEGEEGYGVRGYGDRKFVPQAYNADGSNMRLSRDEIGQGEQVYIYTAYLLCTDEEGRKRPVIASTIGGSASWDAYSGDSEDKNSVILLDLFKEFQRPDGSSVMEGRTLWSYHFGLHSEDDDPDFYARPWMHTLLTTMRRIEGNLTSISAAVQVNAFTGHFYKPDAALTTLGDEAFIEQDGNLKRPTVPGAGGMEPAAGDVYPAAQATVGADAWRQLQDDRLSLQMAVAVDQPAGSSASGHAQVVGETLAKAGKRHIREGALQAVIRDAEDHLLILHAIYEKYGVKWPIQTVKELPIGKLGTPQRGHKIVQYEPGWIGAGNYRLFAEYPEEENLARQDMEMAAYAQGTGTMKRVAAALGEKDVQRFRIEILKDRLWNHPANVDAAMMKLAQARGDKPLAQLLKGMQQQGQLQMQALPGAKNGVPTASIQRPGGQLALPPGGSVGSQSRGGVVGADQTADALVANAEAEMGAA